MVEPRAVVFDLDDTLYPMKWFTLSGFMAASCRVETEFGIAREAALRVLRTARRSHPGQEFQALCRRFDLPSSAVPLLVTTVRTHRPWIRLPALSARVLRGFRPRWRIGVLTNGMPSVQRGKVEALALAPLVDVVVYAAEHGSGSGKPDPATFHAVLDRLGARAERTVFLGDDPIADMVGAHQVGLRTIHVSRSTAPWPADLPAPDARLATIAGALGTAERLLDERGWGHAA